MNIGQEVMTHRGICIIEEIETLASTVGKYKKYTVREKAYSHVTRRLEEMYLDRILPVGTEVICQGVRTRIEAVTPHGYKLEGFRGEETSVKKAGLVVELSRKEWKQVRTEYRSGEYPDIIDDANGPLVVPIHARYSYFWGPSQKQCYATHSVKLID
jgi:hypothetical protein